MTLSEPDDLDNNGHHLDWTETVHDFDVYNRQNEKIGKVIKAGIAELDHSPYLIIKVGPWLASRQVLVSLHDYQVNVEARRVDIDGWSKEEINQLPTYSVRARIEDAYVVLETSTPLESEAALEAPIVREPNLSTAPTKTTHLLQEISTPASTTNETATQFEPSAKTLEEVIVPLLAERVIVDRHKRKSGEVVIRKVIETEVIEVVVRREKLIVEQISPEYKELAVIDLGKTSVEETPISQTKDSEF
jgi:stress response protein YsnF